MSDHKPNKLSRERCNTVKLRYDDSIYLWDNFNTSIVVSDENGQHFVRLYEVSDKHLANLYAEIGARLRLAPAPTMEHIRKLHDVLSEVLNIDQQMQYREMMDSLNTQEAAYVQEAPQVIPMENADRRDCCPMSQNKGMFCPPPRPDHDKRKVEIDLACPQCFHRWAVVYPTE